MENPIKEAITKYLEMEIPYKWEEAPAWARRSYYQNYPDSKCNEKIYSISIMELLCNKSFI